MAKKMVINCGTCDARNVSEETLKAYEQIKIDCGTVIVTPETKNLLNRYAVDFNSGDVVELDKDVQLNSVNGSAQIKSTDLVPARICLHVNGSLEIGPGTEKVLEQYVGIKVNGTVTYPESMSACLGKLSVNGASYSYPDDAIVLKRNAVIDRTFALRAKNRRYWSAKRMVMVDPALDGAALSKKGATFSAKEVILAESKVESLLECIDEQAHIVIVPDGTSVILDDMELNDAAVKRYGRKLYVIGDVEVTKDAGKALEALEYLCIQGDVSVPVEWKNLLLEKAEISGDVKISRGRCLRGKTSLRISKWMLEAEDEGIQVRNCVEVNLDEDIPNDLILNRLTVCDCVEVQCSPEQESALALVCENVVEIGKGDEPEGEDNADDGNTKVINAGKYVL